MASVKRPDGTWLQRTGTDPTSSTPIKTDRVVVSTRYGIELEVFEQIHPVMGWVVVACRKGRRFTQLPGVFLSPAHAEAQMVRLAGIWTARFGDACAPPTQEAELPEPAPSAPSRSSVSA